MTYLITVHLSRETSQPIRGLLLVFSQSLCRGWGLNKCWAVPLQARWGRSVCFWSETERAEKQQQRVSEEQDLKIRSLFTHFHSLTPLTFSECSYLLFLSPSFVRNISPWVGFSLASLYFLSLSALPENLRCYFTTQPPEGEEQSRALLRPREEDAGWSSTAGVKILSAKSVS